MTKEKSINTLEDIESSSKKAKSSKNLCVHELTQRLKEKQRKESINRAIILLIVIFFISFLTLLVY